MTRPPTLSVLVDVWWPTAAAAIGTLAFVPLARTRTGSRIIRLVRVPRISTRALMLFVGIVGTEMGLLLGGMQARGVNVAGVRWFDEIITPLLLIHIVAFMPAGLAVLWREFKARRDPT